ncbi:MAG: magnesium transporter [Gemmataceae bacterium]
MKPLEALLRAFVDQHPEGAAHAFEALSHADQQRLLNSLPVRVAVSLLERINPDLTGVLLEQLKVERIGELLADMTPRAGSALLHRLEEGKRAELMSRLPSHVSRQLGELAQYPEESAGAIMEPRVASLPIDLTVQQAISQIRKTPRDVLYYLYVTQRDQTLTGVLNMRDLLLANPRDPIEGLVKRNVLAVPDTMDREEVVNMMREKGLLALPVVDLEGRLVGVVKHDEALHAGQLEAFEDLQKIVGAGADERALSPVSKVIRSRLPWLYVNLLTAFLASAVIGLFEGLIAQIAVLAVLLPVVAGQGGNTGSQSLAVVMRGLALREIIPSSRRRVILKELMGGLLNGVFVALGTSLAVFVWRLIAQDPLHSCTAMALVIGLAMIVNMSVAALSGAVIPMALKAMGRDPAQSAGIFLTTVTDVVGFSAFLGLALLFQSMLV